VVLGMHGSPGLGAEREHTMLRPSHLIRIMPAQGARSTCRNSV